MPECRNQIDSVKFSQARKFQYEHAYADNIIALITSITLIQYYFKQVHHNYTIVVCKQKLLSYTLYTENLSFLLRYHHELGERTIALPNSTIRLALLTSLGHFVKSSGLVFVNCQTKFTSLSSALTKGALPPRGLTIVIETPASLKSL